METNKCYNEDCFKIMADLPDKSIDFILTDVPYNEVARKTNGLSKMSILSTADLAKADNCKELDLDKFLTECYRICKNSLVIFCGREQFSKIYTFFNERGGTTRPIIYNKTNPVPSNGQYVYLNGVELAVWFKKKGAKTFNAHCKNTVFNYPIYGGKKRVHPTQKHPKLFEELILDNTNEGDIVFDPCAGGMTTALACKNTNRRYICCEINKEFYDKGIAALD